MGRLDSKVAVITGAASGIGRASALLFAREGASIVIADINEAGGQSTAEAVERQSASAIFVRTDVSHSSQVEALFAAAEEKFHKLDLIFSNAAYFGAVFPVTETSDAEWDKAINVTLKGAFYCCKYGIPYLIRNGGGAIICTASVLSFVAEARCAAYIAAKGGLVQLVRSVAYDYGQYGIRANAICPGPIASEPAAEYYRQHPEEGKRVAGKTILGRLGTPQEVAEVALFLASEEASFITGSAWTVDGGFTAI